MTASTHTPCTKRTKEAVPAVFAAVEAPAESVGQVLVSGGTLRAEILHTFEKAKPVLTTKRMFFRLLAGPESCEWA